jgi:sigma-E factor negative regulatory protein RseC
MYIGIFVRQPEQIEHKGVVLSVEEGIVRVTIEVNEACGGCSARRSCAMGQTTKREIEVATSEALCYSVGECVKVGAKQSLGVVAVLLCYVAPLFVLLLTMIIAQLLGCSDGISAIVGLGSQALYFVVLALFKERLSKKVIFTINKI